MSADQILDWVRSVRTHVRAASRCSWFAMIALGTFLTGASWLTLPPPAHPRRSGSGTTTAVVAPFGHFQPTALAWAGGAVVAYLATLAFYKRRAHRTGLELVVWPWAATGLVLLGLALFVAPEVFRPGDAAWPVYMSLASRGALPVLAIAASLPILAWLERSRRLAMFATAFLAFSLVVALYDVDNLVGGTGSDTGTAIGTAAGGMLLIACGALAWYRQRRHLAAEATQ